MKIKEKISIAEFGGKRFKIRVFEPIEIEHKKAVITHYLHNIRNDVRNYYEKEVSAPPKTVQI